MASLVDTGVLLRAFDPASPEYRTIRRAIRSLVTRQEQLIVTVQNVAEFWNVSTRPIDKNGYGLSAERASRNLSLIERLCDVLTEDDASFAVWKGLLLAHSITGVAVHDARLVSVMIARGIPTIITFNARDFRRYNGISAIAPSDV